MDTPDSPLSRIFAVSLSCTDGASDFDKPWMTLCARMETLEEDPVSFSEVDTEFHRALTASTRNGLLIWIIEQIAHVRSQDDWTQDAASDPR